MGLPFLVVVCWVFVAGDNSGFNLEQHMNERDKTAQMMQDSAGNSWGTEAHFQAFADLIRADAMETATRAANVSWSLVCKKMVEFEREACAVVAEKYEYSGGWLAAAKNIAAAIRARGNT